MGGAAAQSQTQPLSRRSAASTPTDREGATNGSRAQPSKESRAATNGSRAAWVRDSREGERSGRLSRTLARPSGAASQRAPPAKTALSGACDRWRRHSGGINARRNPLAGTSAVRRKEVTDQCIKQIMNNTEVPTLFGESGREECKLAAVAIAANANVRSSADFNLPLMLISAGHARQGVKKCR